MANSEKRAIKTKQEREQGEEEDDKIRTTQQENSQERFSNDENENENKQKNWLSVFFGYLLCNVHILEQRAWKNFNAFGYVLI